MKRIYWFLAALLFFAFVVTGDACCMGWFQPPPASPVDPGPVSAPEPGIVPLIGMVASAGVGYFLGSRKK